jgi:tRNA-(ms[2]io[6]A)-hydroxylase
MDKKMASLLGPVNEFLYCKTPEPWLEMASREENLPVILLDHLHCELKAAQSAAFLIRRYAPQSLLAQNVLGWLKPYEDYLYRRVGDGQFGGTMGLSKSDQQIRSDDPVVNELIGKMLLLIKEELHHFEQVLAIMKSRSVEIVPLSAARYAAGLRQQIRTHEPAAFIDKLIVGAYIEARSCERFAMLAPRLDAEMTRFYTSLLRSEARHYQDYLVLANLLAKQAGTPESAVQDRIEVIGRAEAELIREPDSELRFHSGTPLTA